MKATWRVSRFFALAFMLALLAAASFTPPMEALDCDTAWTWTYGYGSSTSSCAAAESNCYWNAWSDAQSNCQSTGHELCDAGDFYNDGCFWVGGRYQMDCHLEYVCTAGPDIPPWW